MAYYTGYCNITPTNFNTWIWMTQCKEVTVVATPSILTCMWNYWKLCSFSAFLYTWTIHTAKLNQTKHEWIIFRLFPMQEFYIHSWTKVSHNFIIICYVNNNKRKHFKIGVSPLMFGINNSFKKILWDLVLLLVIWYLHRVWFEAQWKTWKSHGI